jgi:hypothetical protein
LKQRDRLFITPSTTSTSSGRRLAISRPVVSGMNIEPDDVDARAENRPIGGLSARRRAMLRR